MRKIKVVMLLVRQLQHGFTKNAKVSPNMTVAHIHFLLNLYTCAKFGHDRSSGLEAFAVVDQRWTK